MFILINFRILKHFFIVPQNNNNLNNSQVREKQTLDNNSFMPIFVFESIFVKTLRRQETDIGINITFGRYFWKVITAKINVGCTTIKTVGRILSTC